MDDKDLSAESNIHTNFDTPITYSGDDVIIGWSDTTPNSATASATSGGGYVKLDDSFLTGETIVTLPADKKLYATDDNGNLKKDDNGNAIEASWNEQSLHKLRKGFVHSIASSPLSLTHNAVSYGVGYFTRTATINLAIAAATRFSNKRQRSKYITCDATFININDPVDITSGDDTPGRFVIRNAKLNLLELTPQYPDLPNDDLNSTTFTDIQVNDSGMYQIGSDNSNNVIGHLNIGFDFETISRTEAWDAFLNEVVGKRSSTIRRKFGFLRNKQSRAIMKLELNIHQNGYKPLTNTEIGSPTFTFFVTLLPRNNLKVEYDTSSPYVSRNYSFQIVEPLEDDIKFSFMDYDLVGQGRSKREWNFTLAGHLPKDKSIKTKINLSKRDDFFLSVFANQSKSSSLQFTDTGSYARDFSTADVCVIFEIDNVRLLADGEAGMEFDSKAVSQRLSAPDSRFAAGYPPEWCGSFLSKEISNIVTKINKGLANCRKADFTFSPVFAGGNSHVYLTIKRHYGSSTVQTGNFLSFIPKADSLDFLGIQLLDNSWKDSLANDSLTGSAPATWSDNHITMALYFSKKGKDHSRNCQCGACETRRRNLWMARKMRQKD